MTTTPYLQLKGVSKHYPGGGGVGDTTVSLDEGQMLVLLGPSGCGKTTLLNVVAGLLSPDHGRVIVDGTDLTNVPTHQRNISMVFQTWALFPSMTVEQNVAFGLKMRKVSKAEQKERVAEALRLVRLEHLAHRKPAELSGGQQQRVALARAIVTRPKVLLLDEPLSSLDHQIRVDLRRELRRLQRELGLTGIYVTHDHSEALALGDRIVVMSAGEVVETGEPREVFTNPQHRYTAEFLSVGTIIDAERGGDGDWNTSAGRIPATAFGATAVGDEASVTAFCLKPTSVAFATDAPPVAGATRHRGVIVSVEFEPAGVSYGVQLADGPVVGVFRQRAETVDVGDEVAVDCDWSEAIPLRSTHSAAA